jgi:hypothetical protein
MSYPESTNPRTKLYTIRFSPDEDGRARRLSAYLGVPISTMLRMWLLEKERALGLAPPLKPAKAARR